MKNSFWKELRRYCREPMMLFIIWLAVFGLLIAMPMAMAIRDVIPFSFWLILTIFFLIFAIWVSTCKPD